MFDRIVVSSKRGQIRPEVARTLKAHGLPSHSYSKPHAYEIDGVKFFIKLLRADDQSLGNKSFKIEFNGFDVGSFARATAMLEQIANFHPGDLSLYSIEFALDLLVPPSAIQPFIRYKKLERFRRIYKNQARDDLVIESHSPECETWEVGDPQKNVLVVYNKLLELKERKHLTETDLNFLRALTRIEERYGSLYFSANPVSWYLLPSWYAEIQAFTEVRMLKAHMLPPELEGYSLEGFATYGALKFMRDKNIPADIILQKLSKRPAWEHDLMGWLLKVLAEYLVPPFARMFSQSATRFFDQQTGPMPGLAFSFDGSFCQILPHEIIRGKKSKSAPASSKRNTAVVGEKN